MSVNALRRGEGGSEPHPGLVTVGRGIRPRYVGAKSYEDRDAALHGGPLSCVIMRLRDKAPESGSGLGQGYEHGIVAAGPSPPGPGPLHGGAIR